MSSFFNAFDFLQIVASFVFLISIIDPIGNVPITMNMINQGVKLKPALISITSFAILLGFLLGGEWVLKAFDIPIQYFAVAGGFITFLMALEMILDIVIFKYDVEGAGNIVPLAFPMYAGPGAFTALISMTGEYATINLIGGLILCIIFLFFVLLGTNWLSEKLGKNVLYIIRKFFGIIVLAIACKLMFANLALIFA